MTQEIQLTDLFAISLAAGKEILQVYDSPVRPNVEKKEDDSPLTLADKRSHEAITSALKKHYPDIPILSEEGKQLAYEERETWPRFWLVDPLDGTKEFLKRNGEFTTNIALIEGKRPTVGVIYAPVLDTMYFGILGKGAFKVKNCQALNPQNDEALIEQVIRLPQHENRPFTVVASRSHMSEETAAYMQDLKKVHGDVKTVSAGSSLKLCLVAEGSADVYPRFAPTMEWDTAAGQAIVESAGGTVTVERSHHSLTYNKKSLRNPFFVAKHDAKST